MCRESPDYAEWCRRQKDPARAPLDAIAIRYRGLCSIRIGSERTGWPTGSSGGMVPSPRGDEQYDYTKSDGCYRWICPKLGEFKSGWGERAWREWEQKVGWPARASVMSYGGAADWEERWLEFRDEEGQVTEVRRMKPGWCWCKPPELESGE